MPRYRVDVFVTDHHLGCVGHAGSVNVDAPNKKKAEEMGLDWFWSPVWKDEAYEITSTTHRIPKGRFTTDVLV